MTSTPKKGRNYEFTRKAPKPRPGIKVVDVIQTSTAIENARTPVSIPAAPWEDSSETQIEGRKAAT